MGARGHGCDRSPRFNKHRTLFYRQMGNIYRGARISKGPSGASASTAYQAPRAGRQRKSRSTLGQQGGGLLQSRGPRVVALEWALVHPIELISVHLTRVRPRRIRRISSSLQPFLTELWAIRRTQYSRYQRGGRSSDGLCCLAIGRQGCT